MTGDKAFSAVRRPSIVLSIVILLVATVLMGYLRLHIFGDQFITLSYGLPLLICLWHRDRRLLWSMVAVFTVMSGYKAFVLLPRHDGNWDLAQWIMQLINTAVIAASVHLIVNLMERLESKNEELQRTNEELAAREEEISHQNEELQVQGEELAQQNEELQQQAEELQQQSEEMQAQSEELHAANAELLQREGMLQTLLESLRVSDSGHPVWEAICRSALDLLGTSTAGAALLVRTEDRLRLLACAGAVIEPKLPTAVSGSFTEVVMDQNKTAFIEDLRQRPDLQVPPAVAGEFRSVLSAPLRDGETAVGAVEVYATSPQHWTTEHFRIIEWLATQVSLILQVHRLRDELTRTNANLEKAVQERTARLQELVDELEHFSYSITHDMRAPLRAMQGFAEMLAPSGPDAIPEAERRDYLQRIVTAAGRMDRLITDALSYSRSVRQEMELRAVDTRALLKGMIESYPEFQMPRARIELDDDLPPVLANEAGLTQCFSNLLNNAVKFVDQHERPHVKVRAEKSDGVVRIWFEDNGIGIPHELVPRMFRMFQRGSRKYEGTGIGLALVRKVTERMGGKVGVESSPGKGSRFWLELKASNNGDSHG